LFNKTNLQRDNFEFDGACH